LVVVSRGARAEGPGIKLGEALVLHPGITVGLGYDTNMFYATGNPPDANGLGGDPTVGAFYLGVRPGLDFATPSLQRGGNTPHTVDFRLHAGVPMRFLLSSDPALYNHYTIGVDAGVFLALFPFGHWTFDLFDNFVRTSEPPYSQSLALFAQDQAGNINIDQNQFGLRLHWRPGGERFETTLQYILGLFYYESTFFRTKTDLTNDVQLRFSWKFFPKTALYLNLSETTNTYIFACQGTASTPCNQPPPAYPFRAVLGVIGLITAKLSVDVNIGYANSFTQSNANYPGSNSYNMVIGQAQLTWKPTLLTMLNLGYRHDFAQALIGTYYDLDTAYFGLQQQFWRFVAAARVGWERRNFNGNLQTDGLGDGRIDNLLIFHAELNFNIKDYLILTLGDDLSKNWSNCNVLAASAITLPCNYLRDDVWLHMTFAY
jgi:hypothetical protein